MFLYAYDERIESKSNSTSAFLHWWFSNFAVDLVGTKKALIEKIARAT